MVLCHYPPDLFRVSLTGKWRLIVMKGDPEEDVIVKEVSNHYDD